MNVCVLKGSEKVNEEGAIETKVDTVDQRSPPEQPSRNEKTTVVHLTRKQDTDGGGGRGVFGGAVAAVANSFRSAKDAMFGKGKDSNEK